MTTVFFDFVTEELSPEMWRDIWRLASSAPIDSMLIEGALGKIRIEAGGQPRTGNSQAGAVEQVPLSVRFLGRDDVGTFLDPDTGARRDTYTRGEGTRDMADALRAFHEFKHPVSEFIVRGFLLTERRRALLTEIRAARGVEIQASMRERGQTSPLDELRAVQIGLGVHE